MAIRFSARFLSSFCSKRRNRSISGSSITLYPASSIARTPRRSQPPFGAYEGPTTPIVSPFDSGGGRSRDGEAAGDMNEIDGALSTGPIDCSAGYAPRDSFIVVSRSALWEGLLCEQARGR